MDQSGCPPGWARDEMFMLIPQLTGQCDTPIAAYYVLVGLVVVAKVVMAIRMSRAWWLRHTRILKSGDPRRIAAEKKRLPVIPLNVCISSIAYIALYATVATNQANTYNGAPYALYGFGFTLCVGLILLFLPKIMQLANRLAPFAMRQSGEDLRALGTFQTVMLRCAQLSLAVQAFVFVFLVPIFPNDVTIIRTGMAFQAATTASFCVVVWYHVERVIGMVKKMSVKTQETLDASGLISHRRIVKGVLHKLRLQQLSIVLVTIPVAIVNSLLASLVLPAHWFVYLCSMIVDVFLNVAFLSTSAVIIANPSHANSNGATSPQSISDRKSKSSTLTQQQVVAAEPVSSMA